MSFAVTGLGRCGTMALARILNTAPGWTVNHQNDSEAIRQGYRLVGHWIRFTRPNYGEVSCALMPVLPTLPCEHKAVIVRGLEDTALSAANHALKVGMGNKVPLIEDLPHTVKMLDIALEMPGVIWCEYTDLFKSRTSVADFASRLGVKLESVDIETRHNLGATKFKAFGEIPAHYRAIVDDCRWFEQKWLS